jgi:hypothetical protein
MAVILKEIINAQITDTSTDITYTVPVGSKFTITAASIINTEAATPYTCNVYKIPTGDSAGAANKIINTRTISEKETYPCSELIGQILEAGDMLEADASTTLKLNFIVSGRLQST